MLCPRVLLERLRSGEPKGLRSANLIQITFLRAWHVDRISEPSAQSDGRSPRAATEIEFGWAVS